MEQRSEEWFAARLGVITASRYRDVLAKTKSGPSVTRTNYLYQIVAERLTHEQQEAYQNTAMRWGTDQEPFAMAAYEWETGNEVEEVGLIKPHDDAVYGCSPDGLIPGGGGVEIKCPYSTAVHLKTLEADAMPSEHKAQVQGCMLVTGRTTWDFVSFDPRLPEKLKLFIKPVPVDEDYCAMLSAEIVKFDKECNALIERLME